MIAFPSGEDRGIFSNVENALRVSLRDYMPARCRSPRMEMTPANGKSAPRSLIAELLVTRGR